MLNFRVKIIYGIVLFLLLLILSCSGVTTTTGGAKAIIYNPTLIGAASNNLITSIDIQNKLTALGYTDVGYAIYDNNNN